MSLILASSSPRRRELLTLAGIQYIIRPSECEELKDETLSPGELVISLSQMKAKDVAARSSPEDAVLAADTMVFIDNDALGKPGSLEEARSMLRRLSNRWHEVYTGVTLISGSRVHSDYERTRVQFRELTEHEIESYVRAERPLDKAGAYGIQGPAAVFVKRIEGDYFNIVGLPICKVYEMLRDLR